MHCHIRNIRYEGPEVGIQVMDVPTAFEKSEFHAAGLEKRARHHKTCRNATTESSTTGQLCASCIKSLGHLGRWYRSRLMVQTGKGGTTQVPTTSNLHFPSSQVAPPPSYFHDSAQLPPFRCSPLYHNISRRQHLSMSHLDKNSLTQSRTEESMAGSVGRPFLLARLADASQIPTTALQMEMLVAIFILAALAYVTYGLRMYSRIASKQVGLGKQTVKGIQFGASCMMVLTFRPSHRGLVDDCCHGSLPLVTRVLCYSNALHVSQMNSVALVSWQYFCTPILPSPDRPCMYRI